MNYEKLVKKVYPNANIVYIDNVPSMWVVVTVDKPIFMIVNSGKEESKDVWESTWHKIEQQMLDQLEK